MQRAKPFYHGLVLAIFLLSANVEAQNPPTPGDGLVGTWSAVRFVGEPCARLIRRLEYTFAKDNTYSVSTDVVGIGEKSAKGTFEVHGSTATAYVEGATVGPFPFRVTSAGLEIDQVTPPCTIYLERMR